MADYYTDDSSSEAVSGDDSVGDTAPEPFVDPASTAVWDQDATAEWCVADLPEDWNEWTPPTAPSADSWTDADYSTEWGSVAATWVDDGEPLTSIVPPDELLSDLMGPGHEADIYWADQGDTNYCGLYSVRSILSELYGFDVDINEMIARADANEWLLRDENGTVTGIYSHHIDDILASYGVPSHNRPPGEEGAWDDLNSALINGTRVVVGLDSKEIDAGANVGDFAGSGLDMDHFVAVTGIDYESGVVIVNDSARAAGLEIPIDTFWESWRDSDFQMTVTDVSLPGGSGADPPAEGAVLDPDAPSYAFLGMTLSVPEQATDATSVVTQTGSCAEWLCAPVASADVPPAESTAVDPLMDPDPTVVVGDYAEPVVASPALTIPTESFPLDASSTVDPAAAYPGFVVTSPAHSGTDYYTEMVEAGYSDPFVGDILWALDHGPQSVGPASNAPVSGVSLATGLGNLDAAGMNISGVGPPNTVAVDTVTSGTQWLNPGESPNE